ncbi:MAG: hypothetical protein HRJ53_04880 [Acidobacteria bacterium Pan2503]|uniref:Uncharacterized protein n=1 Tax=Candidatus Acidiferrum panamense TaxID=2741543 RepID=A0A7V8NN00_9BACT|nr:hypothetical protein [Candidatus Acidoferrum panamensis]
MTSVALSPVFNGVTLFNATGQVLSGGKIFSYLANTTTPTATYTTNAGTVANSNPVILNSAGQAPQQIWLVQGVAYKLVLTDAANNVLQTEDNIQGVNDSVSNPFSEWMPQGAPTYLSPTSFSLTGNQTATFDAGRRMKSSNTGGTAYSTVTTSSYNGVSNTTTITVVNDSLPLDSGLSAVYAGVLDPAASSVPVADIFVNTIAGRNKIINGAMTVDQRAQGTAITIVPATASYPCLDRYVIGNSVTGGAAFTAQSVTAVSNLLGQQTYQQGSNYALKLACTVAGTPGSNQLAWFEQRIDWINWAAMALGSSVCTPMTVSFSVFVQGPIAGGILPIGVTNRNQNHQYFTHVQLPAAGVWARCFFTIPPDTSGVGNWGVAGDYIQLFFSLGSGATLQCAPNVWSNVTNGLGTAAGINFLSSTSNILYTTDLQLEVGTYPTPFEREDYGISIAKCQRYYQTTYSSGAVPGTVGAAGRHQAYLSGGLTSGTWSIVVIESFKLPMRAAPSVNCYSDATGAFQKIHDNAAGVDVAQSVGSVGTQACELQLNAGGAATGYNFTWQYVADAEL